MKNVPSLRFKEFSGEWILYKLQNISDVRDGTHDSPKYVNEGYPFITSKNLMENGKIDFTDISYITEKDYININKRSKVDIGDILFGMIGTIGNPVIVEKDGFAIKNVALIKEKEKLINKFLIQILKSSVINKQFYRLNTGGTQKFIGLGLIRDLEIRIPNIKEQEKIASFFSLIDKKIELQTEKVEELKNYKKGIMQKMFPRNGETVPELRFAGFTDAWEQRKLGELGNTFTGLSGKTKEDFGHGEAKFVTYVNVFGNAISNTEGVESVEIDCKQNQVKYGDVFFTTSSETPEEVGMSSVWLENTENVYLNSFCFGYRPIVEFDLHYLAFMLRSPEIRKKFMLLAQGISRYNISKTKVMEMNVPVPSFNEQQKIGSYFSTLDNLITLHQCKLDALNEYKKGLLQQMFI